MQPKVIKSFIAEMLETVEFLKCGEVRSFIEEDQKLDIEIIELLLKEINSNRKSIYLVGKTSAGKSSFLNYILDNISDDKKYHLIPETCKTETRLILKLQHSNNKRAVLKFIGEKQSIFIQNIVKECTAVTFDENKKTIVICLERTDGIECFQRLIREDKDKLHDPMICIEEISLYYPIRYFKDYFIYDTPGFDSQKKRETDKEVEKKLFNHSLILWMLGISEPNLTESQKILKDKKFLLDEIQKEKLIFISNFFDLLDNKCRKEHLSNTVAGTERAIRKKFYECASDIHIPFSELYFTVLKSEDNNKYYMKLTEKSLLEIEKYLAENGRKLCLLNLKKATDKLISAIETLGHKIESENISVQHTINKCRENIVNKEKRKEEKIDTLPVLNDITNLKEFRNEGNELCKKIADSKKRKEYNSNIEHLAEFAFKLPKKIREKIKKYEHDSLTEEDKSDLLQYIQQYSFHKEHILSLKIRGFFAYLKDKVRIKVKEELRNPFMRGLESSFLEEFNGDLENIENKLETKFSDIKENWIKDINIQSNKEKEPEETELKTAQTKFDELERISSYILKRTDEFKQMNKNLLESFFQALNDWKEPKKYSTADERMESFLELYGTLKYIEYLK
jgi:hypothetical protein